jgi:hypothetical protein
MSLLRSWSRFFAGLSYKDATPAEPFFNNLRGHILSTPEGFPEQYFDPSARAHSDAQEGALSPRRRFAHSPIRRFALSSRDLVTP